MKEVLAVIRMNKVNRTKEALAAAGFPALTAQKVMGRGKQRGLLHEFAHPIPTPEAGAAETGALVGGPSFIPKRMFSLVVEDEDVPLVVRLLTKINRTGHHGDGKIFVGPVSEAMRVRTGERGPEAIS